MYNKILVTGGTGLLGTALNGVLPDATYLSSKDVDLRSFRETKNVFKKVQPDAVIHLAGRISGLGANMREKGLFYHDNAKINLNVLEAARVCGAKKVLSTLSTCVYPDDAAYPLTEEQIHSGPPHHSNYAYAYAKRMLDVQSRAYREQYGLNCITAVPNNLFGINDNFDLNQSHVLPAMIRKIYEAKRFNKEVVLWGDGSPLREFTFSDDAAKILVFLLDKYDGKHPINIGNTMEYSIAHAAKLIASVLGYSGEIIWDVNRPSGQFRKPSSNEKLLNLGWAPNEYTNFQEALKVVCEWFTKNYENARGIKTND